MMSGPLAPTTVAPPQVAISSSLGFLELRTADGHEVQLSAGELRAACKCAHCVRARIDNRFPVRFDAIAITAIVPVGDYAINIAFSDGHARGIYPWSYLMELPGV